MSMGRQAFKLQNQWRVRQGARSLKWSPRLYITARAACAVIVRRNTLEHAPRWYAGMLKALGRGTEVSENIGWGQDTPQEIIDGWDRSPTHDANMRDKSLTRGAIATVRSRKNGRRVWVAHYAGR